MQEPTLEIRRGRRSDFTAVMALLAVGGGVVPPPDRSTLRRFRRLIADLGNDFYLAWLDVTLVGLVHVTYTRQLLGAPRAEIEQLLVAPTSRRRGIGSALFEFACRRARKRGCGVLTCLASGQVESDFLRHVHMEPAGERLQLVLPSEPESSTVSPSRRRRKSRITRQE